MGPDADRWRKLESLRAAGKDPLSANFTQEYTSRSRAIELYDHGGEANESTVCVVGRITVLRLMGRAAFAKILDWDGLNRPGLAGDSIS
jgi:lysyl-tRNA synthetase class II